MNEDGPKFGISLMDRPHCPVTDTLNNTVPLLIKAFYDIVMRSREPSYQNVNKRYYIAMSSRFSDNNFKAVF